MSEEMKAKRRAAPLRATRTAMTVSRAAVAGRRWKRYCTPDYKDFLNRSKTERECTAQRVIELAQAHGLRRPISAGMALQSRRQGLYLQPRQERDARRDRTRGPVPTARRSPPRTSTLPRLDLKPHPLYEDSEMAYFKTHYYGGIRKYQWVTIPLQLRGVVALKDGTAVQRGASAQGDGARSSSSPICCPIWARSRTRSPLGEAIPGETLNILHGQPPYRRRRRQPTASSSRVMRSLHEKYGITEDDFTLRRAGGGPRRRTPRTSAWTAA